MTSPRAEDLISSWTPTSARALGKELERRAVDLRLPIAIAVFLHGQRIFHVGLEGSSAENDDWIERKRRTVEATGKSSLDARESLVKSGQDEETLPLTDGLFAYCGGGIPLITERGPVGVAIVSGLPHLEDHSFVSQAIVAVTKAHHV